MPMQLTDFRLIKSSSGEIVGAQMRWRDGIGIAGLYEGKWSEWVDVPVVEIPAVEAALTNKKD